jgi:ketosteroid isomerase-like protein
VLRFARAIDDRDWDTVRACLADDCEWASMEVPVVGPDAVLERIRSSLERLCTWSVHRMTNIEVVVNADAATVRSYEDALLFRGDDTPPMHIVAICAERVRRSEDGWKIARRSFVNVYRSDAL